MVTVREAIDALLKDRATEAYVLEQDDRFVGKLSIQDLLAAKPDALVTDHFKTDVISGGLSDAAFLCYVSTSSLWVVRKLFDSSLGGSFHFNRH